MKRIFLGIVILAAIGAGWFYRYTILKVSRQIPSITNRLSSDFVENLAEEISAPPPLIGDLNYKYAVLTRAGVIAQTNIQRRQNGGLPQLQENARLDKAAAAKVNDIFAKQYFEHVSPSGVGPGDLAKANGYQFVSEGENLALGNFKDDGDLVTAWMNSPGHRANILNNKFTEIGVAVGKGAYEGKQVWVAVQEFGRPASACPEVDGNLKLQINSSQGELDALQKNLDAEKTHLGAVQPTTKQEYDAYNQEVAAYNQDVQNYNGKLSALKQIISVYNAQVQAFNACVGK